MNKIMGSSLVTLLVVGAVIYYLLFMGGLSQIKGMLGGGGSNIQTRTNTGSNIGGNIQDIMNNVQGNTQDIMSNVHMNVNDMLRKAGIDPTQKNVSIQKRVNGGQINYQNSSMFATRIPRI